MQAFAVRVQPSRQWLCAVCVFHAAFAAAVCAYSRSGIQAAVWLALLAVSAAYAWRGTRRLSVTEISVDTQGRARIRCGDTETDARLLDQSRIRPSGLWLCFHTEKGTVRQFVWRDMTDAESFRRLKVWAVWCRPQEKADASDAPPS